MKLFLLKAKMGLKNSPWVPWYDRAFGFLIRANDENEAREIAQANGGQETGYRGINKVWLDKKLSTCRELCVTEYKNKGIMLKDFRSA